MLVLVLGLGLVEPELLDALGEPPTGPLHGVPFSEKLVGIGFEPFQEPLNPKLAVPLVGMLPL